MRVRVLVAFNVDIPDTVPPSEQVREAEGRVRSTLTSRPYHTEGINAWEFVAAHAGMSFDVAALLQEQGVQRKMEFREGPWPVCTVIVDAIGPVQLYAVPPSQGRQVEVAIVTRTELEALASDLAGLASGVIWDGRVTKDGSERAVARSLGVPGTRARLVRVADITLPDRHIDEPEIHAPPKVDQTDLPDADEEARLQRLRNEGRVSWDSYCQPGLRAKEEERIAEMMRGEKKPTDMANLGSQWTQGFEVVARVRKIAAPSQAAAENYFARALYDNWPSLQVEFCSPGNEEVLRTRMDEMRKLLGAWTEHLWTLEKLRNATTDFPARRQALTDAIAVMRHGHLRPTGDER